MNITSKKTNKQQQRVVIHMGAGVHDLTITDPESPTLRGHVLSLKQATRRQKGAVAKALCGALGIVGAGPRCELQSY